MHFCAAASHISTLLLVLVLINKIFQYRTLTLLVECLEGHLIWQPQIFLLGNNLGKVGSSLNILLVVIRINSNIFVLLLLGCGHQASTTTDTSSEDSRSVKLQPQLSQRDWQRERSATGKEAKSIADCSIKDLKMELALEMSKFIEEIEYQLDHVVPMADLCFVGDIAGCLSHRNCGHSHVAGDFTDTEFVAVTACNTVLSIYVCVCMHACACAFVCVYSNLCVTMVTVQIFVILWHTSYVSLRDISMHDMYCMSRIVFYWSYQICWLDWNHDSSLGWSCTLPFTFTDQVSLPFVRHLLAQLHCVSIKTGPLQSIWHDVSNSQRSLIIFGRERLYSIHYVKKILNWLRTRCTVSTATVAIWLSVSQKTGPYNILT